MNLWGGDEPEFGENGEVEDELEGNGEMEGGEVVDEVEEVEGDFERKDSEEDVEVGETLMEDKEDTVVHVIKSKRVLEKEKATSNISEKGSKTKRKKKKRKVGKVQKN